MVRFGSFLIGVMMSSQFATTLARHKPFDAFPEIIVELDAFHLQQNPYHDGEYGDLVAVSLDPTTTAGPTPAPLPPQDHPVIVECENFTITGDAFNVTLWGQNHYFGATLSNTFVSRQALLHDKRDFVP